MCGIVGCQLNRTLSSEDIARMGELRDGLTHRGPDDEGEYIDRVNGLYLGHRRLSILDLDSRSAQPMELDGDVICYNGEIYNYRELRAELGGDFFTESDTEVLLRAWQKWGVLALDKLDGMYGFALRDKNGLHLATDIFGEKPIYLLTRPEGFYFASEAQVLINSFKLKFDNSDTQRDEFISLGFLRAPATGYKNLEYIPPAMHINISSDGTLKRNHYWRPDTPHIGSGKVLDFDENVIDTLRDILCESLERRLRADVPIGLFLSSGVDSTLLAALGKRELGQDLKTYTVSFPDGNDESVNAKNIAKALDLEHLVINSQSGNLWQDAPENITDFYGVPIDNTTVFAIYQMCEAVKKHLTVALSGLGGDELFYGYNKYESLYQNRFHYRHSGIMEPMFKGLAVLPIPKIKTAKDLLQGDKSQQFLRLKNDGSYTSRILKLDLARNIDMVHSVRMFDVHKTMPYNLIPSVDRGSMRAGIEVRSPFLSKKLLEFTLQLDQRALIHFGKKEMLRRLLGRYIDLDLLNQSKQGFVFPLSRYFAQDDTPPPRKQQMVEFRKRVWDALNYKGRS
ncbi:MAG: asparagine synthase (glutamine-hydrolyzing) [Micavibrio sp.]|nr:asparagine synthase (glutamine-hydrolyzing) [Micavibrio sp.]